MKTSETLTSCSARLTRLLRVYAAAVAVSLPIVSPSLPMRVRQSGSDSLLCRGWGGNDG